MSSQESKKQRLQQLLDSLTSRKAVTQAIIAVEHMDESFRWIGAKGHAGGDQKNLTGDTPFFIASIDKMFNATLVMKLVERGDLNLDDTISTYLSPTLYRGLHKLQGIDYSEKITLRHLLTHTSGLADWLEDSPKNGSSLVDQLIEEGDREISLEEIAALVRNKLNPHFPPQDLSSRNPKARYSDTNYMLLITIIEEITGEPLAKVYKQMFIEPMGLGHTYFPGHVPPVASTPEPMPLLMDGQKLDIPRFISSIRGIYSTVGDLFTFLRKIVQDEVFQDSHTFKRMQERWHRFGFPMDRAALRAPGWPIKYGHGLMYFRLPRIFSPIHPMPPVIGHTGSTGCWLFYCPQLELMLAGSVNEVTAPSVPFRIVPKMLDILGK